MTLEIATSTCEVLHFHPQPCRPVRRTVATAGAWTLTRVKATCCWGATIARLGCLTAISKHWITAHNVRNAWKRPVMKIT